MKAVSSRMYSLNGGRCCCYCSRRVASAAGLEHWGHSYLEELFCITDRIHLPRNAGLWKVISGPVYRLLLSLAFAAAPHDELKASTSFLHLL